MMTGTRPRDIQIESNDYAIPYQTDGRKLVKVGVKFNAETRVPEEWIVG